jgi:hypothetical protein
MKTANEIMAITHEAIRTENEKKRQNAIHFAEEYIAPQIERKARMSGFEVFVAIDHKIDIESVVCYLVEFGYEVHKNNDTLNIRWEHTRG